MRQISAILLISFLSSIILPSCKKNYLDVKPDQSQVIPTTLEDMEGLLNNTILINSNHPSLFESGTDDFYITEEDYNNCYDYQRYWYTWSSAKDFYSNISTVTWYEWDFIYKVIYVSNTVLEGLKNIPSTTANAAKWSAIKGTALFYRAYSNYMLAQLYAKPYIAASAATDQGIILRLETDINKVAVRASVQQSYDQILNDLLDAKKLLPTTVLFKTSPSKNADFAMLSRVYLSMESYDKAKDYADSSLASYNTLMDYNAIDTTTDQPFPMYTDETIYYSHMTGNGLTYKHSYMGVVDTLLYRSFDNNDLRRPVFFRDEAGFTIFKGSYSEAPWYQFNGLAVDEMYLNRAEYFARKGDVSSAMTDLNTLMKKRWRNTVPYPTITASGPEEALRKVLDERRKELCFRGIRWSDLKRLNKDTRFAKTLKRIVGAQTFTLPPNDNRYVYPIPDNEILYSGVQQNPR